MDELYVSPEPPATLKEVNKATNKIPFAHKRIGYLKGTIFYEYLRYRLPKSSKLIAYETNKHLLEALKNDEVEIILIDAPSAHFWHAQSKGALIEQGSRFILGKGIGLIVSNRRQNFIPIINNRILTMQKTGEFHRLYHIYFEDGALKR